MYKTFIKKKIAKFSTVINYFKTNYFNIKIEKCNSIGVKIEYACQITFVKNPDLMLPICLSDHFLLKSNYKSDYLFFDLLYANDYFINNDEQKIFVLNQTQEKVKNIENAFTLHY